MKKIIFLLSFFTLTIGFGQEYYEGFDQFNQGNNHPFFDGLYPNWINVNGSTDDHSTPGNANNGGYAHMYVNRITTCSPNSNKIRTEGIALNYNFIAGNTYKFEYRAKSNGPVRFKWYFTNTLSNGVGGGGVNCVPGDVNTIMPLPSDAIEISYEYMNGGPFDIYEIEFTPSVDYDYIWARPEPGGGSNFYTESHLYLDYFKIICGNEGNPMVDWHLENQDGDDGDVLCLEDEIFIDFTNSTNYEKWFIQVCKKDQNTGQNIGCLNYTQWAQSGQVNTPLSLTDHNYYIGNSNDFDFCPGFDYRVQLSLINECSGWTTTYKTFTLECCDVQDPTFTLVAEEQTPGQTVLFYPNWESDLLASPSECLTTQSWCVSESDNSSGPFIPVANITGDFSYVGDFDKHYKVTRKISGPCGEFCCSKVGFIGDSDFQFAEVSCDSPCIDCEIITMDCEAPTSLYCSETEGWGIMLNWNEVPGAIAYIVEIIRFDPECCPSNFSAQPITIEIEEGTSYEYFFPPKCYSWRVKSICEEDESEWSEKMCMNFTADCEIQPLIDNDQEINIRFEMQSNLAVYPNPFNETITLELSVGENPEIIQNYKILNLQGQVVLSNTNITDNNILKISVNNIASGSYYLVLNTDKQSYIKSIVKL